MCYVGFKYIVPPSCREKKTEAANTFNFPSKLIILSCQYITPRVSLFYRIVIMVKDTVDRCSRVFQRRITRYIVAGTAAAAAAEM